MAILTDFTAGCSPFDNGILRSDCLAAPGSFKEVYIAKQSYIATVVEGSEGLITEMTIATGATSGATAVFYKFIPNRETSSFDTNITGSLQAGPTYEGVVIMEFLRNSVENRNRILALSNYDLVAIVKDNNNKYWWIGDPEIGLNVTTGKGESSKNIGTYNKWTVELHGMSSKPEYEVSASLISSTYIINL